MGQSFLLEVAISFKGRVFIQNVLATQYEEDNVCSYMNF